MRKTVEVWRDEKGTITFSAVLPQSQTAVFIMPDRIKEILSEKPDATIDDILNHE